MANFGAPPASPRINDLCLVFLLFWKEVSLSKQFLLCSCLLPNKALPSSKLNRGAVGLYVKLQHWYLPLNQFSHHYTHSSPHWLSSPLPRSSLTWKILFSPPRVYKCFLITSLPKTFDEPLPSLPLAEVSRRQPQTTSGLQMSLVWP